MLANTAGPWFKSANKKTKAACPHAGWETSNEESIRRRRNGSLGHDRRRMQRRCTGRVCQRRQRAARPGTFEHNRKHADQSRSDSVISRQPANRGGGGYRPAARTVDTEGSTDDPGAVITNLGKCGHHQPDAVDEHRTQSAGGQPRPGNLGVCPWGRQLRFHRQSEPRGAVLHRWRLCRTLAIRPERVLRRGPSGDSDRAPRHAVRP